jgi:hypothetical protein
MAIVGRVDQRRHLPCIDHVDVCSLLDQLAGNFEALALDRNGQRRVPVLTNASGSLATTQQTRNLILSVDIDRGHDVQHALLDQIVRSDEVQGLRW